MLQYEPLNLQSLGLSPHRVSAAPFPCYVWACTERSYCKQYFCSVDVPCKMTESRRKGTEAHYSLWARDPFRWYQL